MKRQLPGSFTPGPSQGIVISDLVSQTTALTSFRTPGATVLALLPVTPLQHDKWTILAVSCQAYLTFQSSKAAFGKFGKIVVGLIPYQAPPAIATGLISPVGPQGNPPWLPLPTDASMIASLWDPTVDAMPPTVNNTVIPALPLPISGVLTLPIERPLQPGDSMAFGIWMEPSILGKSGGVVPTNPSDSVGLMITGANFAVIYDDGL